MCRRRSDRLRLCFVRRFPREASSPVNEAAFRGKSGARCELGPIGTGGVNHNRKLVLARAPRVGQSEAKTRPEIGVSFFVQTANGSQEAVDTSAARKPQCPAYPPWSYVRAA